MPWQKFIADVIAIVMLQHSCRNCWNEALVCLQDGETGNLFPWRGNNWRAFPCKINNRMPPQESNLHLPLLEGRRSPSTSSIDRTAILLSHPPPNLIRHEYIASGKRRIKSQLGSSPIRHIEYPYRPYHDQ